MIRYCLFVFLTVAVLVTGCMGNQADGVGESLSEKEEIPTGHPSGTIQWNYVMINGCLYEYDAYTNLLAELPESFDNYVETVVCLTEEVPYEDLQATWLPAGTGFYYSEEDDSVVYSTESDYGYKAYTKCDYNYIRDIYSEE